MPPTNGRLDWFNGHKETKSSMMKAIKWIVVCFTSLTLLGCSSLRESSETRPTASAPRATYDPETDVTTFEKDGTTWQLQGDLTYGAPVQQ